MKLYTEEQVDKIALQVKENGYWNHSEITPIELPSDEEIGKSGWEYTFNKFGEVDDFFDAEDGFTDGAKWMKKQILNQNK